MNVVWAVELARNVRILVRLPESNSWNVGTTRTPLSWAAFVIAATSSPMYSL